MDGNKLPSFHGSFQPSVVDVRGAKDAPKPLKFFLSSCNWMFDRSGGLNVCLHFLGRNLESYHLHPEILEVIK